MEFKDKIVLVTGANRGIGLAITRELLGKDVGKIYAGVRRPDSLPDLGDDRVVPIQIDISNPEQIEAAARSASDVDVLINNAGIAAFGSLLDAPLEKIKSVLDTNFYGTLNMVRAFAPVLESRNDAAIVNVITIGAFVSFPSLGAYSASKAALFSASQGIRMELAQRGIAVHTVNPGPIDTDMAKDLKMEKTSVEDAARNIVVGLERDVADIFPDATAEQMFGVWKDDYRKLEKIVSDMHYAR